MRLNKAVGLTKLQNATAAQMAKINRLALQPLQPEEIRVLGMRLANNRVDRDNERFHEELLEDFKDTIVGKSLLVNHERDGLGIGRFFDSDLELADGVLWLMAKAFILRDGNEQLLKNVDAGIVWAVSIGFFAPGRVKVVDHPTFPPFDEFRRGPNGERGEAIEGSFVFLSSQIGTQLAKGLGSARSASTLSEGDIFDPHPDDDFQFAELKRQLIDIEMTASRLLRPKTGKGIAVIPEEVYARRLRELEEDYETTKAAILHLLETRRDETRTP